MKIPAFIITICLAALLLFSGCGSSNVKNANLKGRTPFEKSDAINKVLLNHLEFPGKDGEVKRIEVPIGGKQGAKAHVDLKTTVEESGKDTFVVTLTKDWNLSINGQKVISRWKYKVTSGELTLIGCEDNDKRVAIIK